MKLFKLLLVFIFFISFLIPQHLLAEELIGLLRTEGSKNFDMEINSLNSLGIKQHSLNELERAEESLRKATNLARQLRDPSLGVTSFNRALVLHRLNKDKEARKYFAVAKRYARGDSRILNSQLLMSYTNSTNE